ncbi:MAG: hypothetical protein A2508_00510 [Candidatus Lambdaproteobacteria bacterium RIFOXYD12_FULL_49_8]|uniref:Uncharacterized protein n=1 Tax=Candidatus Lambdaproteobacteria bacterium RIFOXYD2_FULL_50_16 TaxID=1817772 RepID=A0A1F6G7N0_9PROT|nr:MAG: hypothetical protein A2527_09755 [Candidatus Lambdaproteobacteria bacterium RIFOXYD2_FULL_50_16]OGG97654.1 MAG: hypothetical protein A2508_00510 [Candidatus Lambdaproteobacteria bacterium RIFOXYD12_FULL_49_8]
MKRWISLLLILLLAQPVWAATKAEKNDKAPASAPEAVAPASADAPAEVAQDHDKPSVEGKNKPIVVNPKKVFLVPNSFKQITNGKDTLTVEYESLHKTGKYPQVRIQGIQFNLRKQDDQVDFTWHGSGFQLVWPKNEPEKVALTSSEPFDTQAFSPEKPNAQHALIKEGLEVKSKRQDGKTAKLEVTGVEEKDGKMAKFSVRTFSDEAEDDKFQNENHIPAPEEKTQFEKGVNGEVLFIFTSNAKGQIFVYWR